jgi:predicted signal transduction protein with EAL and GGDEF domain
MQLRVPDRGGDVPAITVSIGVAGALAQETDATALLSRADAALYQAKEGGRNRAIVFGAPVVSAEDGVSSQVFFLVRSPSPVSLPRRSHDASLEKR